MMRIVLKSGQVVVTEKLIKLRGHARTTFQTADALVLIEAAEIDSMEVLPPAHA